MKICFVKYLKSIYSEEVIYPYYLKSILQQQSIELDILNYSNNVDFADRDYDFFVFNINNSESYNIFKNIFFENKINHAKIILVGYYVFRNYYKIICNHLKILYLIVCNCLTSLCPLILSLRDNSSPSQKGVIINDNGTLKFPQEKYVFSNEYNWNNDVYAISSKNIASLQLSIGCNKTCSYCYFPQYWGNNIIYRSIDAISDEITELKKEYGIDRIHFQDMSLDNNNVNRLSCFINQLKNKKIECFFKAVLQVDFINISNKNLLKKLKDFGLYSVFVSIDSANDADLKLYGKNFAYEDISKSIEFLEQLSINYSIGFINFNPYTNEEKLNDNLFFLHKYMFAADFYLLSNRLRIEKKSNLYTQLRKDKLLIVNKNIVDYKFYNENLENIFFKVSEYSKLAHNHLDRINFFTIDFISSVYYLIAKHKNQSEIFSEFLFEYKKILRILNEFHCAIFSDMVANYNYQIKVNDIFYKTAIKDIDSLAFKLKRKLYKNKIDIKDLLY